MHNITNYFDNHSLYSKKKRSYELWKVVGEKFKNKEHLMSKSNFEEADKLCKQINN